MFSSINKTFGCCCNFLVEATKNSFVVPNFVAVTRPFFFHVELAGKLLALVEDLQRVFMNTEFSQCRSLPLVFYSGETLHFAIAVLSIVRGKN